MNKILVTYATMAGSTAEVAQAVGEELINLGLQVKVLPVGEVKSIDEYGGVVIGGPMIMGWHREAIKFIKRHRMKLQKIPFAVFVMAMSLTQTNESVVKGIPVFVDENLPKPPQKEGKLNFKERYARLTKYLQPIVSAAHPVRPASIGVFGGRMEYGRLKWWAVLFAMVIIQAPAGDRRNWAAIREWAAGLPTALILEDQKTVEVSQTVSDQTG